MKLFGIVNQYAYLSSVGSDGGGGSALGNLKTEGDVAPDPPISFKNAVNLPIPIDASTVWVGLARSSPNTTNGSSQSLKISMARVLYEGRSGGGKGSVHEYPARYTSIVTSRHKPLECEGLLACLHMLKTNPHLKGKNVVLALINTVRIAEGVEHYIGFKLRVGEISAQRTDIPSIKVFPLDAVHLDDEEFHRIVHKRISKLKDVKKNCGTRNDVTKALNDDRTDEEVEQQYEIDEKAKQFRDELDDNDRGHIREASGLTSFPDDLQKEFVPFTNDMNGEDGLINVSEEEIPTKVEEILAKHGGKGLPTSHNSIRALGYSRSSLSSDSEAQTFREVGFHVIGPLATGDDLEEGVEGGDSNAWERIPLSQWAFIAAAADKKGAGVASTPVFYDKAVSRSKNVSKFPDELLKCLFLMVRLKKTNIPLIVKQLNRFVTGERPVVCKSVIEFCRQIGNELVVAHDIGYKPTDMMNTESSRILEIKLIWSEFHSDKEDLIQRLPLNKQEEHNMYARLERTPIGKLQSMKEYKEALLQVLKG